jgi:hypothetical protein
VSSTTAGAVYYAGAYVAAATSSAVGKKAVLVVRERTSSGTTVAQTSSSTVTLGTAFQRLAVTATVRDSGDRLDMYLYQGGAVSGDAFYADLVTLTTSAASSTSAAAINEAPCTVTIDGTQQTGTCSGTFTPKQAPSAGASVNAAPTGPASPSGGWHVAFADGFGAPIGTEAGQDNFWYPNEGGCCHPFTTAHGNNTDELEGYNASQVRVGNQGLELIDEYHPNAMPAEGSWPVRNYLSGAVQSYPQYTSIHPFTWEPGKGETWAFECVCKLPPYFNGLDTGWWSTDWPWTDELDFFESWTSGINDAISSEALLGFAWVYETEPRNTTETWTHLWRMFDPSAAFHRYTTVITPNDSVEEYVDGVKLLSYGPPPYLKTEPKMALILSNALRSVAGANPDPQFISGTRTWDIRSIAVYEDAGHAGQNVTGGGVAPGTTLGP